MAFWIAAAGAALLAALWLVRPLLAGRRAAPPRAAHDLQVFRDQLRSLDRDVERGALAASEAEGARAEISRRLLAAAAEAERDAPSAPAPRGASRALAAGLVGLLLVGGGGLYLAIGAPGQPDRPLAARLEEAPARPGRPDQAEAERRFAERRAEARESGRAPAPAIPEGPEAERLRELIAQLRDVLAERPENIRGRRLLADNLMRLDDPAGARAALEEVIEIRGEATSASDRAALAEAMVLAAGGYVSPQAERQIRLALQADEREPVARYYAGIALAQAGRFELALDYWRGLLREGPADAPWVQAARARLPALEAAAAAAAGRAPGGETPGGDAPRGPDAADIEAAGELSPEDREAMVEGMVARLESRLAEEGGPPEDWARLLRAYGVLARPEDAARIWNDARRVFADAPPEALERLREAAAAAGVEVNGGEVNGVEENGRDVNGRDVNGRDVNGRDVNGRDVNGRDGGTPPSAPPPAEDAQ